MCTYTYLSGNTAIHDAQAFIVHTTSDLSYHIPVYYRSIKCIHHHYHPLEKQELLPLPEEVSQSICFVTAFSSNHFHSGLRFLVTAQHHYHCNNIYVYDLGLSVQEKDSLASFPFVHMLSLNMTKPYFPNDACAFKPILMLDFITRFQSEHQCRYFFYGDASVLVHTRFDQTALEEVHRLGLIAQKPLKNRPQLSFT